MTGNVGVSYRKGSGSDDRTYTLASYYRKVDPGEKALINTRPDYETGTDIESVIEPPFCFGICNKQRTHFFLTSSSLPHSLFFHVQ